MTNIVDFAKAKLAGMGGSGAKKAAKKTLQTMKAVLLVMVAVVSGVLVVGIVADLVLSWGIVILYLTIQIGCGLAIGSLAYAAATKLLETVWQKPSFQF